MSTNQPEPTPHDGPPPSAGGTPPPPPAGYAVPPAGQAPPPAPGYPAPPAGHAPPAQYGTPGAAAPLNQSEERMWAMLGHIGGIFLGFLAPLITWLVFRERSAFVNDQGKEALNFQITVTIAVVISSVLTVILIGFLGLLVVGIADLVLCIMAGIAANNGTSYRYPFTLRLIK